MSQITSVGGADRASPLTSQSRNAKEAKKSEKGRNDQPPAMVSLSSKGKKMAEAMSAKKAEAQDRAAQAEASPQERMNELIEFYANKLVRAAQKMQQKAGENADGQETKVAVNSSGMSQGSATAVKGPSITSA